MPSSYQHFHRLRYVEPPDRSGYGHRPLVLREGEGLALPVREVAHGVGEQLPRDVEVQDHHAQVVGADYPRDLKYLGNHSGGVTE